MSTDRVEKVLNKVIENGGNMSQAMIKSGYSEAYAHNSTKLTNTDKWQRLLERKLKDTKLTAKVNELLDAQKVTRKYVQGNIVEETTTIDAFAINAGLTHAFKLKNKYPSEKLQVEHSFPIPLLDVSQHQAKLVPNTNTETLPTNK